MKEKYDLDCLENESVKTHLNGSNSDLVQGSSLQYLSHIAQV